MTEPYFQSTAEGLMPRPHAHAPWGDGMLHGRLLGGLAARALEADLGEPGWRAARLTVDLFRPSAMAPVQVEVRRLRSGRRLRLADAVLRCDGHDVVRATALFLAESEEPPGEIWRPESEPWPGPDEVEPVDDAGSPDQTGWWFRPVEGSFYGSGRTRLWTNETAQLVEGEDLSPFVRTVLSSDIACPLANSSDDGLHYINADYTLLIGRQPAGEWVGLEVAQHIAEAGISMASCTLVDLDGPFATSSGVSLARPPMLPDA